MNHSRFIEKDILSKQYFLERLRIEKLRVDRSKASLSVGIFSFHQDKKIDHRKKIQDFLKSLHENTRETDMIGWIDSNVIGLILPDTDKRGVQICVEKIRNSNGELTCSVVTGTYPDDMFHKLLNGEQNQSQVFPTSLDESIDSQKIQLAIKRCVDVIGALVGLLLSSPLMLVTALAIKVTSPGPIIFKQNRLGKNGVHFPFYKFRSMYWNVDDQIHREYVTNLIHGNLGKINQGDENTPLYKMKFDPRVTLIGKIIRKTSIDELPQFFNVLKGEMSLVGPRPPIPYEIEKYEPWHLRRVLHVKPGITGLWQVGGRSTTSFNEMVRLDLRYAQNWSLWLDLKILLKTVRAVIHSKGAL